LDKDSSLPDGYLQNELESSLYMRMDQTKSTQEVKADMESDRPMDRLVCGDVGFGKRKLPFVLLSKR
jgi:transcription-repair coupling factor (superfamily II helicase)